MIPCPQRLFISAHAAIEGLAQLAHLLAHRDIAHAQFAQHVVQRRHIGVEQLLGQVRAALAVLLQPHEQQQHMQGVELETRVDAVRDAQARVKIRLAGLIDGQGVQGLDMAILRLALEECLEHRISRPLFRRAVALGRSDG